jgi:hypothetical protein
VSHRYALQALPRFRAAGHCHFKQIRKRQRKPSLITTRSGPQSARLPMSKFKRTIAFAMLCASSMSSAYAGNRNQPLSDCVDLAPGSQMTRFGSQYLLVKDGDAHYRIGFNGNCSAISLTTQVKLRTGDQDNRLCPSGTRVLTKRDSCTARDVVLVDEDAYASYVRRSR